jgi:ankyrin repeat protein
MLRRCLPGLMIVLSLTSLASAANNNARYLNLVAKRKYSEAAALLVTAANANNAEAQYRLAVLLRSGLGIRRDETRARKLLKRAAAAGHKPAQVLLNALTKLVTTGKQPVEPKASTRSAGDAHVRPEPAVMKTDLAFAAVRAFTQLKIAATVTFGNAVTADGKTPLMLAAGAGNLMATRALLDPATLDTTDQTGKAALHLAVHNGHRNAVELLLENGAEHAASAGVLAARRCDEVMANQLRRAAGPRLQDQDVASQLVAFAANCEGTDWFTEDLANAAVSSTENWSSAMTLAIQRKNPRLLQALLAQGSDPNVPLSSGTTALCLATAQDDAVAVAALLGAGADPALADADGNTPLMLAATHGSAPVLNQLLSNGPDLNSKNAEGKTALYIAVESLNVGAVRMIAAAGGAVTSRSIARDTPEKLANRLGRADISAALQGNE